MWVSLVIMSAENGIGELSLNSSLVYCIHFYTNALTKGMNPFFLPFTTCGLNSKLDLGL